MLARRPQKWYVGAGVPCDWLGDCIWLSLVGPELEQGHKSGKLSVVIYFCFFFFNFFKVLFIFETERDRA